MKRILKGIGIGLGSIVVLLLAAYAFIYFRVQNRFDKKYEVTVQPITIPSDSASLALGQHLAAIKGCGDCHGDNFGGKVVVDDPGLGMIAGPNITTGKGGLITRNASFSDLDYVRAIRHGLNQHGTTLKLMPSYEYQPLSNKDLGSLIAYLKSVPPVDNEMPAIALNPLAYVLANFDKLPLIVAEKIDHTAKNEEVILPEVTVNYGQYVAVGCVGCHRDNYQGGEPVIPGSPVVPNISATGSVGKWSEAQFIQTLRTGVTPDGKKLDPKFMPWTMTKEYTDIEIKSLYLFLKSKSA